MPLKLIAALGAIAFIITGVCVGLTVLGSGVTWWATTTVSPTATPITARQLAELPTPVPPTDTPSPSPTATATETPSPTATATPTATPVPTHTATPEPPTATSTPRPPTATHTPEPPTATPTPAYSFEIAETAPFPTNHLDFDVYVAITNADNNPLSGYKIVGTHSSGLQVESAVSTGDWTENSGAMFYKAGNIKYQALNSPPGMWTLQLVNGDNQPVAPPVEFPFEQDNLQWYFLLYRQLD